MTEAKNTFMQHHLDGIKCERHTEQPLLVVSTKKRLPHKWLDLHIHLSLEFYLQL